MHLHLNPLGGLAGDMFCAALLDARPELLSVVREAVRCLEMPLPVVLELHDSGGVLRGKRFSVTPHGDEHDHHHRAFREIRRLLEQAPLATGVRARALSIFTLLAVAEGRVHGVEPKDVSFHEVGSWDSIADIVGAAALLEALEVSSVSCAPLPLGGGRIPSAHGLLPVPAPATALLLEGLPVVDDGIGGERVTPTGAAIVKSLAPTAVAPRGATLLHTGMGFGSRTLEGIPNCLQVLCIASQVLCIESKEQPDGLQADRVGVLGFEVDDQTPEEFALALDRIRETNGVLSVTAFPGIGKSGRPTMSVEVLARPERMQAVAEVCFRETTTIGLRWNECDRFVLPRSESTVQVEGRELGVKRVQRPQGATAKVELQDLAGADGQAQRLRLRRLAEAQALEDSDE